MSEEIYYQIRNSKDLSKACSGGHFHWAHPATCTFYGTRIMAQRQLNWRQKHIEHCKTRWPGHHAEQMQKFVDDAVIVQVHIELVVCKPTKETA